MREVATLIVIDALKKYTDISLDGIEVSKY